jgi:uncharacterized GH25 family protein
MVIYGNRGAALASGVCLAILLSSAACAHDIWLTEGKGAEGHVVQVDFGDLSAREMPDVKKLATVDLITPSGRTDLRRPQPKADKAFDHPILVTGPFSAPNGSVVIASYDNGFWVTAPGDRLERNASALLIPNGTGKHWTVKYAKLLLGPGSYTKILGVRLELVAMKDPFSNPGSTLPVKLLLNGKPCPDADIVYTDGFAPLSDKDRPIVKTGADGVAQVPFHKGLELLTTDLNADPLDSTLSEKDHIYASLTFQTAK